ncbi:MAG TPA: TolC family protein [Tepidisphaeraceae bacterium]
MFLVGCAPRVDPRAPFADVKRDLSSRISQEVVWDTGTEADRQVRERVRAMLAAGEVSADKAVQVALLNNRKLRATYQRLGVAQADLVAAGLLKNPVFDADLRFSTRGGGTGVDLSLLADFLDALFIPPRKHLAEAQLTQAKAEVTAAVLDLSAAVREGVYQLVAARETVEMRRAVVEATSASAELARRLREAGNLPELELAAERAAYEQSKIDLSDAESQVVQLHERLNALMGIWGRDAQWTVAARLPDLPENDPPVDAVESQAIAKSLDLARSRAAVEVAAQRLGITRPLGWLSDLEVGAAAEREVSGGWSVGPAFSLPIPLFSQGQPALVAAAARLQAAVDEDYAAAVAVRAAARAAWHRVTAARLSVVHYRQVVLPLRHTVTQEMQKRYNAMLVGAFDLLRARQQEIDAGAASVNALRAYWLARARLETIFAGRVPGGIGESWDAAPMRPDEGGHP